MSCGGLTRLVVDAKPVDELKTEAATLDERLDVDCENPVPLGKSALSKSQTTKLWGKDRAALGHCRDLHKETREFYKERDSKLSLTK